ncbi:hypothetical protein [Actinomadura litoris]|nr:hypothetical protein [Actinomadura litoris]
MEGASSPAARPARENSSHDGYRTAAKSSIRRGTGIASASCLGRR